MKPISKDEMKKIKAGIVGGGGGPVYCRFTSSTCGVMCLDVTQPTGPFPGVSSCAAYMAYLNPTCHFTYVQVTHCP